MNDIKRITWVDSYKGILIFLVVLGHCLQNISIDTTTVSHQVYLWIYCFHMTAFFVISGYLTKIDTCILSKDNLVKKLKKLILPAYFYMPFVILYKLIRGMDIDYSLISLIKTVFLMNGGITQNLWFFSALFSSYLIICLVRPFLLKKIKIIIVAVILMCLAICCKYIIKITLPFFFEVGLLGSSIMLFGNLLKEVIAVFNRRKFLLVLVFLLTVLYSFMSSETIGYYSLDIGNPLVFFFISVIPSVCILIFVKDLFSEQNIFSRIGLFTDRIYGTHWVFVALAEVALYYVFPQGTCFGFVFNLLITIVIIQLIVFFSIRLKNR